MLSATEQENLFKALYIKTVKRLYDGRLFIEYVDGKTATKSISELSQVEKDKVWNIHQPPPLYFADMFLTIPQNAEAWLVDGRKISITNEAQRADFQESLSGEKYRRPLLFHFQTTTDYVTPRAAIGESWFSANYSNYLSNKFQIIDFWKKVHLKKYENLAFDPFFVAPDPYPEQSYFQEKLWSKIPADQKNLLIAEDNRRYQLRSGDSGFFAPLASNLQDFATNANQFVERNKEPIAAAAVIALTGGVAAAGGFGAGAAAAVNSAASTIAAAIPAVPSLPSLALPSAPEIGAIVGSQIIKEAKEAAEEAKKDFFKDEAPAPEQTVSAPQVQEKKPTQLTFFQQNKKEIAAAAVIFSLILIGA